MQNTASESTNRTDELTALGFASEVDYTQHKDVMQKMRDLITQQLRDTRAAGGPELVHLSKNGPHAGRRFCLAPTDQSSRSVHAIYAPLSNPTFLAKVCEKCLHVWALEAYDDENIPDYLVEPRAAAKLAAGKANVPGEKGG
jgi:hypothetical protein